MTRIRTVADLVCIALMVALTIYITYLEQTLSRSVTLATALEQQARDWELAAANYQQAASNFREAAFSCIAKQRQIWEPLLDQKAFNTTTPTWKLPLGVVEKP